MALTPEERAARMAELKAARESQYFAAQEAAKIASTAEIKTANAEKGWDVSQYTESKPAAPPPDNSYDYEYVWRSDVGGGGSGQWKLVRFPNPKIVNAGPAVFSQTEINAAKAAADAFHNRNVGATPQTPSSYASGRNRRDTEKPPVKTAPIDTILFNQDDVPIQIMADLIFEDIGGQELINIARNDTINGQTVIYQPIKNLTQIQQQYNPNNILKLQNTSDTYFENFPIKFDEKVPGVGNGPNGAHVYIDPLTGDLIIETIGAAEDEEVQVEITVSGTIYEAEI